VNKPLTPRQAADRLGVTAETVVAWADAGKLPCFRTLGGHRRFRVEDVDALIESTQEAS
jgi:excisionase family DNA binding protein